MRNYSQLHRDLLYRAYCLPVPRTISYPFITLVVKWVRCSGEAWTVDRLKSIKLDIIRIRAGLEPVGSWVITGHRSHFGGIFGQMERKSLLSEKWFHSIIQLLMVYSYFVSKSVTLSQEEKFLSGVQATLPRPDSLAEAKAIINTGFRLSNLRRVRYMPDPKPLLSMVPSSSRKAPTLQQGSVPEVEGIIDSLDYLWLTEKGRSHYNRYKRAYDCVMSGLDWYNDYLLIKTGPYGPMPNLSPHFVVGRIGLIQEPGYKLRAVANPGRVFQRVLEPLGDTLYRTLKALPWDCTFDQAKAHPALQDALSRRTVVHSIDLSGATDYFPLELQEFLLKKIFPSSMVECFSEISQGTWDMPGFGQVSWTRGQPLGLYPSFGSFALTHGILLLGLLNKPYNGEFFVLGDDVVILDSELAKRYHQILDDLECPVSLSKSLTSNELCEFAGKVITHNCVIPQFKWRVISDDSFIDLVRNLGCRAVRLLRKRQKQVVMKLASLPECLGGFGWNPNGVPLTDRLKGHQWIWEDPSPHNRATSYTGQSITTLFSSDSFNHTFRHGGHLTTNLDVALDQRAIALTKEKLGGTFVPLYRLLGKNLDMVLTSQLLECDLPIEAVRDNSSSLHIWERKVGIN